MRLTVALAFALALACAAPVPVCAQVAAPDAGLRAAPSAPQLLNSERIEQRFGSYGVEVLHSDAHLRVSNLYSEHAGQEICRTFAVVEYARAVPPAIATEHEEIVRGGSIGAVFAAHGWRVLKANLRYFATDASERVAALMHVAPGTRLAAHAYVLEVEKAGRTLEYAWLVEIHHPDYLRLEDLRSIYGEADAAGRERALEQLLATARRVADEP